jgi:hypothetical protein
LATVVLLKPVPGDHTYEVAPLAVKTVLVPIQMVDAPEILTTGRGVTVTVTAAVLEHPLAVPVTVYVVVAAGDAVGLAAVVLLNPAAGDQL